MRKSLILIPALLTAITAGAQRWQQNVRYSIDVILIDSTHSLNGNIRIRYINHSPDTLSFIWMRCWPNAFKNDRTAFSEQSIRDGRTDFYFSDKSRKGYINRLDFRVDGQVARMEDHPQYIDVIKITLPHPLPPGDSALLQTPFHVQLPDNFAGDGFHQDIYAVTQWFPKPAVYDDSGWHPDPYLGRSDTYNEFGDFDVRITVPAKFVVAATGQPQTPLSSTATLTKTISYHQSHTPDFVWFASRRFHSSHDTLLLPSGRTVDLYAYYLNASSPLGRHAITYLKDALRYYSSILGDYPFDVATVVETRAVKENPVGPDNATAAYPAMIGVDSRDTMANQAESTITKEIVATWLSIAVGANSRRYPWMTEGIGIYYYQRYARLHYHNLATDWGLYVPDTFHRRAVNLRAALREDQPVSTASEDFTADNYRIIAGYKTAIWMYQLQRALDTVLFDSCMREYIRQQQFHHAGPADLKAAFSPVANRHLTHPPSSPPPASLNLDSAFALLDTTGPIPPTPYHRPLQPNLQLIPHPARHNYLNIAPALGFNNYDHWMMGALIHNVNLVPDNWQLLAAPLYSTTAHQWNGLLHLNYAWYPSRSFRLIEAGINGSRFSTLSGIDSNHHAIFGGFYKVVPYFRLFFPRPSIASTRETSLEGKVYLIGEKSFDNYVLKSTDSLYYPVAGKYAFRYLTQLTFSIRDPRILYPYSVHGQIQQAAQWYRINLGVNYFFNYENTGGLSVRLFGAKFGYLGTRNPATDLSSFEPKLTAVRGSEDYTYDNYFIGRNDFNGLASQQIMMRDGNLKLRTDLFQGLQGRSDNWVAAVNLNSTLPPQVIPPWLPLHLFLDLGTYADAWSDNPPTSHFLYVGGAELDLFRHVLRIYAPLIYSSDFSHQLKTVPDQNGFFQKLSFSLDFQQVPFRKWFGYTPF